MTSLGTDSWYKYKGFRIRRHVAGDLSHTWNVAEDSMNAMNPISFASRALAKKYIDSSIRKGMSPTQTVRRGHDIQMGWTNSPEAERLKNRTFGRFKYLTGADAVKYAKSSGAYGDYVEQIRRKHRIKVSNGYF
jgi:hypothetical protein